MCSLAPEAPEPRGSVPPPRSGGVWGDVRHFFLHEPEIPTLIRFNSRAERRNYSQRIMQRLGIRVEDYSILNIHQIGVEAPVRYVFEELERWSGDSTCWPNHIAEVSRVDGSLEHIRILLFGWSGYPFGIEKVPFGLDFIPLFNLDSLRIQRSPAPSDLDNARYLLYACSGGYPIGIFSMYARSSIAERREREAAQLFLVVGFNFYGKEEWSRRTALNKTWELVHNRVTANVMNRFKALCEWRFQQMRGMWEAGGGPSGKTGDGG